MSDLVERLREVSQQKESGAWRRQDGGQDLSIGAMLADEAADEIERLEGQIAARLHRLERAVLELNPGLNWPDVETE